jgi:protein PsiE
MRLSHRPTKPYAPSPFDAPVKATPMTPRPQEHAMKSLYPPHIRVGSHVIRWLEYVGLVLIAAFTVLAIYHEILVVIEKDWQPGLADLLLMFIYLEVLAMVGLYMESGELPVRLPLYIGIVALARYLILDIKDMEWEKILAVAISTLLLAVSVAAITFSEKPQAFFDAIRGVRKSASTKDL